jgi:hypothetical protein
MGVGMVGFLLVLSLHSAELLTTMPLWYSSAKSYIRDVTARSVRGLEIKIFGF